MLLGTLTVCIWGQPFNPQSRFERQQREQQIKFQIKLRDQERKIRDSITKGIKAIDDSRKLHGIIMGAINNPLSLPAPIRMEVPSLPSPIKAFQLPTLQSKNKPSHYEMKVDSMLNEKMRSSLNIDSVFVIVKNHNSGRVIAMGKKRVEGSDDIDYWIGSISPIALMEKNLSVLENGSVTIDTVETCNRKNDTKAVQNEIPENNYQFFVGRFPSDKPHYSIYVELYKNGEVGDTNYAADLCKDIAELMIDKVH